MFKDLFDFSKTRNFKESVGFYIAHTTIFLVAMGVVSVIS
tara:strand:+ start:350 stop:469 length:120 start_codon:yes stop_codon:yes gene_type:complete